MELAGGGNGSLVGQIMALHHLSPLQVNSHDIYITLPVETTNSTRTLHQHLYIHMTLNTLHDFYILEYNV